MIKRFSSFNSLQELKSFGLKAIPRKKAVNLLRHIYEQTQIPKEKILDFEVEKGEEIIEENKKQNISVSSLSSEDEDEEDRSAPVEETLFLEAAPPDEDEIVATQSTQSDVIALSGVALSQKVLEYITSSKELHEKALMYDPIWLEDFFNDFKKDCRVRCKLSEVTDVFDVECITFRTRGR